MPRRKPTEVIVQRIELGDWERDQIGTAVQMSALAAGAGALAAGAGVALAGVGTWFTLRKMYGWKDDVAEAFDKVTNGLGAEVIFGKGTYTDADGNEVENPFAGIPVMGSLFGSGMMIGQRFNPFS
jgi:hypothetical protein